MGLPEARDQWLPWVLSASAALPVLERLDQWPACMRNACLLLGWATDSVKVGVVDGFVRRLFGLGLAVLSLRMRCEWAEADAGRTGLLFPDVPKPGRGCSYPWGDLVGPPPRPTEDTPRLQLMPRLPRGWKWDQQLAADILRWARRLQWAAGKVTYAEPALDFELTVRRALPARPKHSLRMTVLPLQKRAAVLR